MHSMTGFGRGTHATAHVVIRVEAYSVNRKQGEVQFFMPRDLAELEARLRKHVLSRVTRGRVNINVALEHPGGAGSGVRLDLDKARALKASFVDLSRELGQEITPGSNDYLRAPDIFVFEEDYRVEEVWEAMKPALDEALDGLVQMRAEEGADLQAELERILARLDTLTCEIEEHAPSVIVNHRESLLRRLREADLEIDAGDERLLKEVALFADRCDITEEITRLRSHFRKFHTYMESADVVGRAMDFLCQEINREFNTIGSKANDAVLAQAVVHAKTDLEKIREQVQNIE
ncbi:MAG: YicC family protein [Verrucomicrobiaceae bacterium]|nr:YicC family protein [Verrucomicrobiaceae bacterium]